MRTATSKLTRKYQATIPARVRKTLGLRAGDSIAFDMDGEKVRVRKARPVDLAFTQALEGTLQEWGTAADQKAFRDL